jgi:hypothetical protein
LFAVGEVFQDDGVGLELGVAEDEGVGGAFAVGDFELGFEGAGGEVHVGGDVVVAQFAEELELCGAGGVAVGDEPEEGAGGAGELGSLRFEGDEETFEAGAEADAGGGSAAEVFDEVVVAAAAAEGVLGAESAGGDFPEGFGVVVEAADEVGVDFEKRVQGSGFRVQGRREELLDPFEVAAGFFGEGFVGGGGALGGLLVAGVFAVEDAEGVGFEAALRVVAELLCFGFEEGDEGVAVALFGFGVAEAVDLELEVFDAAAAVEVHLEEDALDVLLGVGEAEGFGAELVVLAEAALLGAFVSEIGGDVIDLGARALLGEEVVLDHRADDAGGAFGAEGHRVAAAVVEGEGFLVDDVTRLADAAVEELGVLHDGGADFVEVVELGDVARDALDGVPFPGGGGEDVFETLGGLDF